MFIGEYSITQPTNSVAMLKSRLIKITMKAEHGRTIYSYD